jgi:hypothetical protein
MDEIILKNLCSKIVFCGSGFNKRLLPSLLLVPPKGCWFGFKSQDPGQNLEPANIMENYLDCTIVIVFSLRDREFIVWFYVYLGLLYTKLHLIFVGINYTPF